MLQSTQTYFRENLLNAANHKPDFPILALVWLAAALAMTAFSPAELTLGSSVKLVFLHAALMWVAFIGFTASGVLSIVSLVKSSPSFSAWADSALSVATGVLVSTGLLGILTAILTWGGVLWGEPRMQMLAKIIGLSLAALIASRLVSEPVRNALRIGLTVGVWYLLLTTERIVHPVNPIFTSGNVAIIAFPLIIASCLLLAAYTITKWLQTRHLASL